MSITHNRTALVAGLVVTAVIVAGLGGANDVSRSAGPQPVPDRSSVASVTAASGDEIRVGVIGSRFDRSNPALAGQLGGIRRGGGIRPLATGSAHGTAVAEVVAERSPAATLYLAELGPAPSPEEYVRAVEWLTAHDVDVIVDAGSYFPRRAAGLDRIERAAEAAATDGVAYVTSAGNYANRHWRGTAADTGWVSFTPGSDANRLGREMTAGQVTLRLYWEGQADYDLYLYRRVPDGPDQLVAQSARDSGRAEAIDTVVTPGEYYVRVYAESGGVPVDLFAANNRLAHADSLNSGLPPATGSNVIAVGAADATGERAYSSDVRDVTATDGVRTTAAGRLVGSSAATPVVAGTVTSMLAASDGQTLSPMEIHRILRETADGSADRLDSEAALARVDNSSATPSPRLNDRN